MPPVNRKSLNTPALLSALTLTLTPLAAIAAEELVLEEVLVTAQKQEQNINDTPVAVNAISAKEYTQVASFDLRDLDRLSAGVDLSGDAFNIDIKVRGTGTNLDAGVPARVQIFKDGAFISRQRPLFLSQFDIERFELLRGPQGTLYGKPSPAGSIVIHTQDPSLKVQDGYVQISAFSRDGSNTQFGVSQPLIEDKLGLRLAGSFDKNSNADIHNETLNEDQILRTSAGRATIKWLPTERLDARVSYNYTEHGGDYYTITDPNGGRDGDDRQSNDNARGAYIKVNDQHAISELNYAVTDDITLTNVTGYQETYTERQFDLDAGRLNNTANNIEQFVASDITKVLNSEIRLHNTTRDDWQWITGIYYQTTRADTVATTIATIINSPAFSIDILNQTEEWGLFHHSGVWLNDDTKLTVGARYNDARINARSVRTIPGPNTELIPLNLEKRSYQEFTGTLKIQHHFDDDTMAYFSFDRGWRPASATVDAQGTVPAELILHDDEPSTNFEFGMKGRYWNDRADYQVAIYRQLYQDFQYQADGIQRQDVGGNPTFNTVVNADKVKIDGIEIESNVLLSENWSGFYSLSYVDVEFDKFDNAPCNTGSTLSSSGSYFVCDLSGERATDAPNFSGIVSTEYFLPLEGHDAEWYLRLLAKHESSRYERAASFVMDDYTTADIFTGVRTNDGKYELMLWAKNVTDEDVLEDIDFAVGGATTLVMNNPFTAGITATWRFGLDD